MLAINRIIIIICIFIWTCFNTQFVFANVCPKGTYQVRNHPRSAYYRSDETYVSATTVSAYCKQYRSFEPLEIQFENTKPTAWPYKKEIFKNWKKSEIKQLTEILNKLPDVLTHIGNLKIFRADKSIIADNPASSIPGKNIIVLYDSAIPSDTKRIIIHELAHILYENLSEEEKDTYNISSGWIKLKSRQIVTNRTTFSAPDGANSVDEDFANNIEYYFADSVKFKNDFRNIYDWINRYFGGKQ